MVLYKRIMKTLLYTICLLFFLSGCQNVQAKNLGKAESDLLKSISNADIVLLKKDWPEEKILNVPFVMQAPLANWEIHNESCEEAGILLANYYYLDQPLSKEQANQELLEMVDFEKKQYGGEFDIYAQGMGQLASDYYGYNDFRVLEGNVDNIKKEINNDNPVIVPTTAAYLKPEKSDYPEMGYHVVVVVGYNRRGFVTHDPGTYSGENFTYSYSALQNAMKDYDSEVLVLK